MAGRKKTAESENIDSILENEVELYVVNDKFVPPSSEVWEQIRTKYSLTVSKKCLYTRALRKYKCKVSIVKYQNLSDTNIQDELLQLEEQIYEDSEENDESSSDNCITDNSIMKQCFTIRFSPEEWKEIMPPSKLYKDKLKERKYLRLKPGLWTNKFSEKIWKTAKRSCSWKYTRQFIGISEQSSKYLDIRGDCGECGSKLFCYVHNKIDLIPEEVGLEIKCVLKGNNTLMKHKKKSQIRGIKRKQLGEEMVTKNIMASVVRKNMAGQLLDMFEKEAPVLPRLDSIRKIKSEIRNADRLVTDPIKNLELMAQRYPLQKTIHEIGLIKYYTHYWAPDQVRVYNSVLKKEKHIKISIDATGGLVKKISRCDGLSGHIFLYVGVRGMTDL